MSARALSSSAAPRALSWRLNLVQNGGATGTSGTGASGVEDPAGYVNTAALSRLSEDLTHGGGKKLTGIDVGLKQKKAWEVAQAPAKQVGMMAFMMWMSGNSVQIFSIMMTMTGIFQPLRAISTSSKVFVPFRDPSVNTVLPQLLFCLIQFGGFLVALYKLNGIGLLPTHTSDWISQIAVPREREVSFGGLSLM